MIPRAALGLALFLALAAPVAAATPPQVYLSCTSGAAFITTPVCTSMTTPRGGILLTNVGTNPLVISSLTFTGPDAGDFSVSQGCVGTILTGQICSLTLTFSPKGAGLRTAFLNINSNAPGSPYLFPVNGIGSGSGGGLSPSSVSFGSQLVNTTSAPQTVTLTNTGSAPLNISSVSLSAGAPFAITSGGGAGSLAAGASRAINVSFTPTAAVPQSATLTVATDSTCGTFSATLTGTGTSGGGGGGGAPAVGLTGTSFANQCVNTTSSAQTVTLTNTGTADLNITGISLPAGSPFQFAGGNQTGTLPAGASRSILVTFTPTVPGMQTADLMVTSNAVSSPNKVTLSAMGISTGATATLTPGTVPFGTQTVGTTSGAQNITLTNTSGGPLTISSIALTPNSPFQITAGQTAGTLPIGGSQTISVVFKPASTGFQTATLTVASAALCGPLTTTLTGTGQSVPNTPSVSLSRTYISFADLCLGGTAGPLCFTITNTGTAAVALNSIGVTNCSSSIDPQYIDCARVAGFQIVSGGGPGTLAAGQSRDVCLTFTPGEAATFSAFVMISTNASTTPLQVELHGTGDNCGGPLVSLTGATFGSQCLNTTSGPQTATLTNTGSANLDITNISVPAGSPFAITSGNQPGTLAPGASRSITLTFTPTLSGVQTTSLTVLSNAASSPNTALLSGTGITAATGISLTPGSLTFAARTVNTTSAAQDLTLTNTGSAPLSITGVTVPAGAPFAVTAGGTPGSLAVGASRTISVTFTPAATGPASSTLTVATSSACGPLTVALSGTGQPPPQQPGVVLTGATFAAQCVGTTSAAQTVTLTNNGTAALNITSIALPAVSPFKITSGDTPGTLAAGAARSIQVTFTPGAPGVQTAPLTVISNAASSPDKITLSAKGITSADIATLTPGTVPFGSQQVNTTSAVQNLTLTNTSGAPLTISSIAVPAGAQFAITSGGTVGTLPVGGTQTIGVVFKPTGTTPQTATLTVESTALCTPLTATLTGTGTPPPPSPAVGLSLAESFTQCVGTTGAAKTVTLTNTGGADLTITSITLPAGSPFKITSGDTPGTLTAGASRSILVTFSPTVAGSQSADLTVVTNAASSPDKITLPGLGTTAATTATLAPTSLAFADQALNTPSAAKTITLTNTSGGSLTLTGLTLAGANPGSFQITAGGQAGTLAAGATRTISLVFQPIAGGAQTATLAPALGQPGACTPVATLSGNGTCGPLSITCPPDLNVCLPSGQCAATGISTTPTVTPNVASTTLVCVRDDGQPLDAPYPFGTTTITCTATDACGNTAHCVRRVTVQPGASAQVHMFIAAVNGAPTTGMPDELHINVGDCVTLKLLVTVDGCTLVQDVTGSASFFTDPPRGTFTGSTWCATAAEQNSEFPLYGDWTNPCTGTTTRDTVHIHVNRNDGLQ